MENTDSVISRIQKFELKENDRLILYYDLEKGCKYGIGADELAKLYEQIKRDLKSDTVNILVLPDIMSLDILDVEYVEQWIKLAQDFLKKC